MRHLVLHYPEAPIEELQYQYLLGMDMLICPVIEAGAETATVYLPDGQWIHVWSGHIYTSRSSSWKKVAAPIGQPPVFLRADSPTQGILKEAFRLI
jgi:sulfoquinovosidase